jgi:hypothetical protein
LENIGKGYLILILPMKTKAGLIMITKLVRKYLRKSGTTTWEVFDIDFDEVGLDLEWDGDDGLGKLWGLYYKCPNMQFFLRVKAAPPATATTTSLSITGQEYVLPNW